MKLGARIGGWFRKLGGIKSALFVSAHEAWSATTGLGKVGQGLDANVVMAPVQFVQRTFTQSVAVVAKRLPGRKFEILDEHPLEDLLANPNPFYGGDTLTKAFLLSWFLDGNAYILKVRNALGAVVQLWYIPHWFIAPAWPRLGGNLGPNFITHYEYNPDGTGKRPVAVRDVIHLRVGVNPRKPREGLSPIAAALREVLTDEEAATFSAYILGNMGVPGGIIAPANPDQPMPSDQIEEIKELMTSGFTGKKRGNWMVFGQPTKIEQFGFDPNRLMLGPLRDISEERICAMLGVPAAVVGFGAGLQSTKVGSTMRELVKLARVNCIEPTQVTIGRQISRQLLPDFEPDPKKFLVVYDNSGVSKFLEDEDAVARRAGKMYTDGVSTRNESRSMVRLDPVAGGDTFAKNGGTAPPPDRDDEGAKEPEGIETGEGDPPSSRWAEWGEPAHPNGENKP